MESISSIGAIGTEDLTKIGITTPSLDSVGKGFLQGINGLNPVAGVNDVAPPVQADGGSFAASLTGAIDNLQGLHARSGRLAIQAATGDLRDVHDYTIAATEARLATQLTVAVRDKAVGAFNEIMRMQA